MVAQGDNGKTIPNYANLIGSPASAMISNQYVPGIATDPATDGYWMVGSDGGIFAYAAPFEGTG